MDDRDQQIETLIKLIELNLDDTWLEDFEGLRSGGYLPGGGAGSLNDWGPIYSDEIQGVWYGKLYDVLRHFFDHDLNSNRIDDCGSIKFRNNIRVLRCLNCIKSYQHPASFEGHIALDFYQKHVPEFAGNLRLKEILIAGESFENEHVIGYRKWLVSQYNNNNIKIYDFVSAKYVCPHCGKANFETEHDLYKISTENSGQRRFALKKQNAVWKDFEQA